MKDFATTGEQFVVSRRQMVNLFHPYYLAHAAVLLSYAGVRQRWPSDALQETSPWLGTTRVRANSAARAGSKNSVDTRAATRAQEAEIIILVVVAIVSKARKAVTATEIVDKLLMFGKAGLAVLMYFADKRLMMTYLAVFAGLIARCAQTHAR